MQCSRDAIGKGGGGGESRSLPVERGQRQEFFSL